MTDVHDARGDGHAQPFELRWHQSRTIDEVRAAMRAHTRVLLVAPTGFGKTAVSAELMRRAAARGRTVLFLVHRREIVLDTVRRLRAVSVPTAVLMAGEAPPDDSPVTVASIATIVARESRPAADFVIWDEAHHATAESYRGVAALYPNARHLGLTATPMRADGVGMRDAFDAIVVGATVRELQEAGFLASCDVYAPPKRITDGLAEDPVDASLRFAAGRRLVVFFRDCSESRRAAVEFTRRGVSARHIDGATPALERDTILAAHAAGDVTALCNVHVLTEGWDSPATKVCVLARGFSSVGAYLQAVGRVLRPHDGERALVLDLAGNVHDHGTPDEERTFTLDGISPAAKSARPWLSQCLGCGLTVQGGIRGEVCMGCGRLWPVAAPMPIKRAELAQRRPAASHDDKRREFARLLKMARDMGYAPGWAHHRYRARFGVWPRGVAS